MSAPLQNTSTTLPESLSGLIERVTFSNEDTGFSVLKVKAKGHRDLVTVVGSLPSVSAGEWLTAQGRWVQDREFGLQFRAEMLTSTPPTTKEGIEKYLGSGMVKGIGPIYAKKLVDKFGEKILTSSRRNRPAWKTWTASAPSAGSESRRRGRAKGHPQHYGFPPLATESAPAGPCAFSKLMARTPSRRSAAIRTGWPRTFTASAFKTADQIAQKIGIPVDSLIRACAGLSHVLIEATGDGHCALPLELLKDEAGKLLQVEDKIVTDALERTLASNDLVKETINGQELIFLPHLKRAEEIIAGRIRSLAGSPSAFPAIDFEKAVVWCQQKTGKELAPSQRDALKAGSVEPGPGHHRRPGCRQDDTRQHYFADPAGQESALPALRAHGPGGQTPFRSDRW
jgi:exodeoxyribonuclease V alpha subunit